MKCPGRWIESNASIVPEDKIDCWTGILPRITDHDCGADEKKPSGRFVCLSLSKGFLFLYLPAPEPLLTLSASGPIQTHQLRPAGGREERAVCIQTNSSVFSEHSTVAWKSLGWTGANFRQRFAATAHGRSLDKVLTESSRIISSYRLLYWWFYEFYELTFYYHLLR